MTFHTDGSVDVERLPLRDEVIDDLESNLIIYYSGVERAASTGAQGAGEDHHREQGRAVQRMHRIKELGHETKRILLAGTDRHLRRDAPRALDEQAQARVQHVRLGIDEHYEAARKAGAIGGKLMGAGGGGFFMFYVRARRARRVQKLLAARGLRPMRFRFDFDGARIMANFHRSS
jgi:D-glycero-alpha-D-manno-heptose-7-phosphate kinase